MTPESSSTSSKSHHFSPHIFTSTMWIQVLETYQPMWGMDPNKPCIYHVGSGILQLPHLNSSKSFQLNHLLHTPSISKSLIYVHKFAIDNLCFFVFLPLPFSCKGPVCQYRTLLQGSHDGSFYHIFGCLMPQANVTKRVSLDWWHYQLGRPCE